MGPASKYKITRNIEANRAITVLVHDNELADVIITPSDDSTELFENGATDTIDVALTREPGGPVTVELFSNDNQLLFSADSLVRMLEERGFEIARKEYLISTSSWIISHQNYFKDRAWPKAVQRFFNYQNPILLGLAVIMDTIRVQLGLATSNQRVIGRKPSA